MRKINSQTTKLTRTRIAVKQLLKRIDPAFSIPPTTSSKYPPLYS